MRRSLIIAATVALAAGCGQRDEVWDSPVAQGDVTPGGYGAAGVTAHAMRGSVALVDTAGDRVIFASPQSATSLAFSQVKLDHGYAASHPTSDGAALVALTRGDVPRRRATDEGPSLSLMDTTASPPSAVRYPLADPLSGLEIDPTSELAIVYPSASDTSFVQNPNELVLVKLKEPPSASNPVPTTLRSFGGRPVGFTFTPPLELPGEKSRLLVVRTDRDVAIIDLSAPDKPEITVKLSEGAAAPAPASIAVSDGEAGNPNDARLAVRLEEDSSVILLDLLPTPPDKAKTSPHGFLPAPNIIDVGGVPSDVTFGRTDGGLRLLALVPSKQSLVLVEPSTGVSTSIDLGAPFEKMSLVTDVVGQTDKGSDVALLWSTSRPEVAFVALGATVGKPYKSVERLSLDQPVGSVIDVPAPNEKLKLLRAPSGDSFVVLNLLARTASPLLASVGGTELRTSPDGLRLWVNAPSSPNLALVTLDNLHPQNLLLNYPVTEAFDVLAANGQRAALALHARGSMAFTLLDGQNPSVDASAEYLGILLGDYQ
jgi:hypothetical protein